LVSLRLPVGLVTAKCCIGTVDVEAVVQEFISLNCSRIDEFGK